MKAAIVAGRQISRNEYRRDFPLSYHDRRVQEFDTTNTALNWLESELLSLTACIEQAANTKWAHYAVYIASAISEFLLTSGHRDQAVKINQIAADSALVTGNRLGLAHALNDLGTAQRLISDSVVSLILLNKPLTFSMR